MLYKEYKAISFLLLIGIVNTVNAEDNDIIKNNPIAWAFYKLVNKFSPEVSKKVVSAQQDVVQTSTQVKDNEFMFGEGVFWMLDDSVQDFTKNVKETKSQPKVSTKNGILVGKTLEHSHAFYGVPYAQPPTEYLRLYLISFIKKKTIYIEKTFLPCFIEFSSL